MRNDRGRNSLSQAIPISSSAKFRDQVSQRDPNDFFQVNVGDRQRLNLKFKSTGRANVQLIQDKNQDGLVNKGEVLKRAVMRPGQSNALNTSVAAGTYAIRISHTGTGTNQYRLVLTQSEHASPTVSSFPEAKHTRSRAAQNPLKKLVNQVVTLTNNFRRQNGLTALTLNSKLTAAAQKHTQNMALQDFFDHTGRDGSSLGQRISAEGYKWSMVAENIGAGYGTAADVVNGWINSPGHRANLLNPGLKQIGVGYYFLANDTGSQNWHYYWTQDFGTPR
jgi:uncharacterized protein YkwD